TIGVENDNIARRNGCSTHNDRFVDRANFRLGRSTHTYPARPDRQAQFLQFLHIAHGRINEQGRHVVNLRLSRQQFSNKSYRRWLWHGQDEYFTWLNLVEHSMHHQVIPLPTTNRAGRASYFATQHNLRQWRIDQSAAPSRFIDRCYSV